MVLRKLSPKLKVPGSFSVPYTISSLQIDIALCDLGASINSMPYSVYKLGLQAHNPLTFLFCLQTKLLLIREE